MVLYIYMNEIITYKNIVSKQNKRYTTIKHNNRVKKSFLDAVYLVKPVCFFKNNI
jgi:hypothetical protein